MPVTLYQFLTASLVSCVLIAIVIMLDETRRKTKQAFFLQKQAISHNGIFKEDNFLQRGPNFIFFHDHIKIDVSYACRDDGIRLASAKAYTEYPIPDDLLVCSKSPLCLLAHASLMQPIRGVGDHLFDKKFIVQTKNISFAQELLSKNIQMYLRALNDTHMVIRVIKADRKFHRESLPYIDFRESIVEVQSFQLPEHEFEYDTLVNTVIMLCQRLKERLQAEMNEQINNLNMGNPVNSPNLENTVTPAQNDHKLLETRESI